MKEIVLPIDLPVVLAFEVQSKLIQLFFKTDLFQVLVALVKLQLLQITLHLELFGYDCLFLLDSRLVNFSDCSEYFIKQLHSAGFIFFK